MVDVAGRPLYAYGMDALLAAGCDPITILAGQNGKMLNDVRARFPGADVLFRLPMGILRDIAWAGPYQGDTAMVFGDEFIHPLCAVAMRARWDMGDLDVLVGYVHEPDGESLRRTYAILVDPVELHAHRFIEKPAWAPCNAMKGTGFAIAKAEWVNAAKDVCQTGRNWVDLWQNAVDLGARVSVFCLDPPYFNVNTQEELQEMRICLK